MLLLGIWHSYSGLVNLCFVFGRVCELQPTGYRGWMSSQFYRLHISSAYEVFLCGYTAVESHRHAGLVHRDNIVKIATADNETGLSTAGYELGITGNNAPQISFSRSSDRPMHRIQNFIFGGTIDDLANLRNTSTEKQSISTRNCAVGEDARTLNHGSQ
jgi:hypothetical protein